LVTYKPKRRWNLIESIFFILLVLIAGFVLLRSPLFEVRRIEVRGNQYLSGDEIVAVSGISTGTNIFKLNLHDAAVNLQLLPMVKKARLVRNLPAMVTIDIEERKPLGLLPAENGFIEVDEEGVCLQKGDAATRGLPIITGVKGEGISLGQPVEADGFKETLAVLAGLPEEVRAQLSEIHRTEQCQFRVYTLAGIQCRLGGGDNIQGKGKVLSLVLKGLHDQEEKIEYIDLSYAGKPVFKYKR